MSISTILLEKLQRESMLKSALYSARIEGNSMTFDEAKRTFLEDLDESSLLPKRAKILEIIRKNKNVNLKQIKRRFTKINERTLRYDLKKLQEQQLIRKLGTTRGVYYTAF